MAEFDYQPPAISRSGDRIVARLERIIEDEPQRVWAALTRPEALVQWLAPGSIDLRVGGAARLNFADSGTVIDSTVTALEPPRLIEYSWSAPGEPERPVRWEIAPAGDNTQLTLTLTMPASEDAGRSCAGWAAHLEMLAAALAGVPIKFPFETFKAARDAWRGQFAASPGP